MTNSTLESLHPSNALPINFRLHYILQTQQWWDLKMLFGVIVIHYALIFCIWWNSKDMYKVIMLAWLELVFFCFVFSKQWLGSNSSNSVNCFYKICYCHYLQTQQLMSSTETSNALVHVKQVLGGGYVNVFLFFFSPFFKGETDTNLRKSAILFKLL